MKKFSIIVLAATLMGLPGCGDRQKAVQKSENKERIEENVDMFSSIEMEDMFSPDDFDEEEDNLRTFFDFDEEAEEFVPSDEDGLYGNIDMDVDDLDDQVYSWIDTQTEDELKPLYFGFNKCGLTEEQKNVLAYDIEQLKMLMDDSASDAQPTIVAEGHTCQEGDHAYNMGLSEKRAKTVEGMLLAAGFDKSHIKVVGRGSEVPAVINGKVVDGTREQRAPNRRVELKVVYT